MATTHSRLTAREGRRFGFTVGCAFLVLALVAWWRGRTTVAEVLGVVSVGLILAAAIVPTRLGPVERFWMALAHSLSRVTTPIVMAAMYFGVITPIGLLRRLFGHNPVEQHATMNGFWKPRTKGRSASLERQF